MGNVEGKLHTFLTSDLYGGEKLHASVFVPTG
jgi:hypothetical protein